MSRPSHDRPSHDRPSFDGSSTEFSVADSPSFYADAHDPEAQRPYQSFENPPQTRHDDNGTIRSKRSLRSLISRKTNQSNAPAQQEKELNAIKEEDDSFDGEDDALMDLKEAKLQDQGVHNDSTEQFARKKRRHRSIQNYTKSSKSVVWFRKVYDNILSRTLITRSFIWWLPLAAILFIPLAVDAWAPGKLSLGKVRVMWLFIWLEVAWGSLFVARQFAHYMPGLLGFFIAIIYPSYFFVIDALIALEIPITVFLWLFVTFITFTPITATNPKAIIDNSGKQDWQNVLQNVLVAFFLSGLFFMIEQLFIHMLSVSYHKTRMAQRIRLNKRSINIISKLLFTAWSYFPVGCPEFKQEDSILSSTFIASADNAGAKMKKFLGKKVDIVKHFKNAKHAISGAIPSGFEGTEKQANRTVREALPNPTARTVLGERIWKSLVPEGEEELDMDDILEALGKENNEDSMYIFDLLDLDGQGSISLDEMITAIRGIGKESKNISRALQDMDGAITKLHYLLLVLLAFIVIVIFVGMVAPSAATVLATLGTTILGVSFIFSATCAEILASCVFLFVKHPIDIGDVVQIDAGTLGHTKLIVRNINLLTTVFEDATTATIRQAPNSVLNTLFIDNITRSPPQTVLVQLVLGLPETTFAVLEEFRTRLEKFISDHPRDYFPDFFYQITDYPDLDRLQLTIIPTMRNNQVDMGLFSMRRTRFYEFISRCIHDIPLHIPKRDLRHTDPAAPMFAQNIDHLNRKVEREPTGMAASDATSQNLHRTSSLNRGASVTGMRKRTIQSFNC